MKKQYMIGSATLALLAAGIFLMPDVRAAGPPDSEMVSGLLSDAKTQAFELRQDAMAMEAFTRTTANWESHAEVVGRMKDHVNAVGRTLTKLEAARSEASPWQATAIDRIRPLLKEIASNTQTVIEYINKNPRRLGMKEYTDYIEANSDVAAQLSGLVADFVDYGNTKDRLERLAKKLELPLT